MAYLQNLNKFYVNFTLWRVKNLRLEYNYLLLLSNSYGMKNDIADIVEAASEFVNETHIRDEYQILGSVWFFNNLLIKKNRFSDKKDEVLKYLRRSPTCKGSNNLWSAVETGLEAFKTNDARKKTWMLVFTDGYDVQGDFGQYEILQHNIDGLRKIVDKASSEKIKVHFLALERDKDDHRYWDILENSADEMCDKIRWINIVRLSEIEKIIKQFRDYYNQVQVDVLRICTLENFGWRFLEKGCPPTRWYLYPGLVLCMYLEKIKKQEGSVNPSMDEVSISVPELKNTLSTFIRPIVQAELWMPKIQEYIDLCSDFNKQKYSEWISQNDFIDNYVNVVLEAMKRAGWVSPESDTVWVVRKPHNHNTSVILYLMEKYFLSDTWKEPQELTSERPKLKGLMKKFFKGQPRPCLDDGDMREIWPL